MLAGMDGMGKRGGDRKSSRRLQLDSIGITKSQSSRWQRAAVVPEVLVVWRSEMAGEPHRPKKEESNNNIITSDKATQGTSKAYTLARLQREAPALFNRVKAGELYPQPRIPAKKTPTRA